LNAQGLGNLSQCPNTTCPEVANCFGQINNGVESLVGLNPNVFDPTWTITQPAPAPVLILNGLSPSFTVSGPGVYTVSYCVRPFVDAAFVCCCKTFTVGTPPPMPCITYTLNVNCSRLEIFNLNWNNGQAAPSGAKHQWGFELNGTGQPAWTDGANPLFPTIAMTHPYFNINTYVENRTLFHRILNANGTVVAGSECSVLVTPADWANPLFYNPGTNPQSSDAPKNGAGIFIGGSTTPGCTTLSLTQVTTIPFSVGAPTLLPDVAEYDGSVNNRSNIYIDRVLKVDKSYRFRKCNIWMGINAKLEISNGTLSGPTLTVVEHTEIKSHCDQLWQSIQVGFGAVFESNPNGLSGTNTGNLIRDAVYGVHVFPSVTQTLPTIPPITTFTPGGTLSINRTTFEANFIGLFSANGKKSMGAYTLSQFDGNTFQGRLTGNGGINGLTAGGGQSPFCTAVSNLQGAEMPFVGGMTSFAGIVQIGVPLNIPIIATSPVPNVFKKMADGIIMRAANTSIQNCRFADIERGNWGLNGTTGSYNNYEFGVHMIDGVGTDVHTYTVKGLGKTSSVFTFNNVKTAVHAGAQKLNMVVNVTDCKMTNVQEGVTLVSPNGGFPTGSTTNILTGNISTANIKDNDITVNKPFLIDLGQSNLFSITNAKGGHGIWVSDYEDFPPQPGPLSGFSTYNIENNLITVDLNSVCLDKYYPVSDPASGYPSNWNDIKDCVCWHKISVAGIQVDAKDGPIQNMECNIRNKNVINVTTGYVGISLAGTNRATVFDNTVNYTKNNSVDPGMNCPGNNIPVPWVKGIETHGGHNNRIHCNSVVANTGAISFRVGVDVNNSPSTVLQHNTIRRGNRGLTFSGANGDNTAILDNTFNNAGDAMDNSLVYNSGATTPSQICTQNQWLGTYNGAGVIPLVGTATGSWKVGTAPFAPPSCGSIQWFTCNSGMCTNQTNGCVTPPLIGDSPNNVIGGLDDQLVNGVFLGNVKTQWLLSRNLYQKLKSNPSLAIGNTSMNNFLSSQFNLPLGKLGDIAVAMQQTSIADVALGVQVGQNSNDIAAKTTQLNTVLADWKANPTNTTLQSQATQLAIDLDALMVQSENLEIQAKSLRNAVATTLTIQNNAITSTDLFESNEKLVNQMYLASVGLNQSPTTAQLSALAGLAVQCPSTDGPAVFAANSLYASLTGVRLILNDCNLMTVAVRSAEKPAGQVFSALTIQPNPASDRMMIGWGLTAENTIVTIYNVTGQPIKQIKVGVNENQLELDTAAFPSGIYTLVLQCGNHCHEVKQFVVHH
jgi:Secretion system C-terminal sorting domain